MVTMHNVGIKAVAVIALETTYVAYERVPVTVTAHVQRVKHLVLERHAAVEAAQTTSRISLTRISLTGFDDGLRATGSDELALYSGALLQRARRKSVELSRRVLSRR